MIIYVIIHLKKKQFGDFKLLFTSMIYLCSPGAIFTKKFILPLGVLLNRTKMF